MLGAWQSGNLVGLCGRNIDPYDTNRRAGRVRHLYVDSEARRAGVGRQLITGIIAGAHIHFDYLNTNAPPTAFPFYQALGFEPVHQTEATYRLTL